MKSSSIDCVENVLTTVLAMHTSLEAFVVCGAVRSIGGV